MDYAGMTDPPFPPFPVQPKPSHQPPSLSSSSAPPGPEPTTSSRADGRSETTKKQKRKENPSLLATAEGSSSSPSNSSPASHEQPKGGTGADIESLLGILVGQVRDLKDSLKGVQKELKAVNKRQKMFEDHHRQLKERVELLIPLVAARASQSPSDGGGTSPPSSVSSPDQASLLKLTAHPHIPAIPFPLPRSMPRTRAEILDYFPLLKSYEGLYSPDAPFVIDEFTYAFRSASHSHPPDGVVGLDSLFPQQAHRDSVVREPSRSSRTQILASDLHLRQRRLLRTPALSVGTSPPFSIDWRVRRRRDGRYHRGPGLPPSLSRLSLLFFRAKS
jgi:hypothetical protein